MSDQASGRDLPSREDLCRLPDEGDREPLMPKLGRRGTEALRRLIAGDLTGGEAIRRLLFRIRFFRPWRRRFVSLCRAVAKNPADVHRRLLRARYITDDLAPPIAVRDSQDLDDLVLGRLSPTSCSVLLRQISTYRSWRAAFVQACMRARLPPKERHNALLWTVFRYA